MRKARWVFVAAAGAAAVVLRRRSRAGSRERADLYFDDGSMVSLAAGSPEGERLVLLARAVLGTTR